MSTATLLVCALACPARSSSYDFKGLGLLRDLPLILRQNKQGMIDDRKELLFLQKNLNELLAPLTPSTWMDALDQWGTLQRPAGAPLLV